MNVTKPKNDEAFIIIKRKKTKLKNYFYLTNKNNLDEAAKNLDSCLRNIKNEGYKSIAVEKIPNKGLGKAINDRLRRASKYYTSSLVVVRHIGVEPITPRFEIWCSIQLS